MAYHVDGNQRSAVPPDRALLAQATRQRQPYESARNQCHSLCGRARLQVARAALAIQQLAHRLHAHESLVQKWVLDRVFEELQHAQIVRIKIEAVGLDSTIVKVHPDGTGALKKTALKPSASRAEDGAPRFIWLPRMLERP